MFRITLKIISSLLISAVIISALGTSVFAEAPEETKYLRLSSNYTVGEFLERYKCTLPEGDNTDSDLPLGSGLLVESAVGNYITVLPGDVDGDGLVSTTDYLRIKSYFSVGFDLADAFLEAADINEDGAVDTTDILRVKSDFLNTYSINPVIVNTTLPSSRYYNTAMPVSYYEEHLAEDTESRYLLKVRVDGISPSVSRSGKEIDWKDLDDATKYTMPEKLTVTEILSENGKDKFTVGETINAGTDWCMLQDSGDGTYTLDMSKMVPQYPALEIGREYIVIIYDLAATGNTYYTEERLATLPYAVFSLAPTWTKNLNSVEMFSHVPFFKSYQALVEEYQERYCSDYDIPDDKTVYYVWEY